MATNLHHGSARTLRFAGYPASQGVGRLCERDNFRGRKRGDEALQAAKALLLLKSADDFHDGNSRERISAERLAVGGGIAGNDRIDGFADF